MVVEGIAAEGEEDLVPPAPVGGRRRVEKDGDQRLDVLDAGGLKVELGDHGIGRVEPVVYHPPEGGAWWEEEAVCSTKGTVRRM